MLLPGHGIRGGKQGKGRALTGARTVTCPLKAGHTDACELCGQAQHVQEVHKWLKSLPTASRPLVKTTTQVGSAPTPWPSC